MGSIRAARVIHALAVLLAVAAAAPAPAHACGADSDCQVAAGDYRIRLPAGGAPRPGAIVYLHEFRGSPEQVMAYDDLARVAARLGVALIAPRGIGGRWALPGAFAQDGRDEIGFVRAIVDDAVARFGLDRGRVLIAGFSLGGSLTWYVACRERRAYMGYAPVAGAFWLPYPRGCATPLPYLRHVHGRADTVVPLVGRRLSQAVQGDTFRSFALLRDSSRCAAPAPAPEAGAPLACAAQNCGGARQTLCLHAGGHFVVPLWIETAWREAEAARGGAPGPDDPLAPDAARR